jgi:hypothetical protein
MLVRVDLQVHPKMRLRQLFEPVGVMGTKFRGRGGIGNNLQRLPITDNIVLEVTRYWRGRTIDNSGLDQSTRSRSRWHSFAPFRWMFKYPWAATKVATNSNHCWRSVAISSDGGEIGSLPVREISPSKKHLRRFRYLELTSVVLACRVPFQRVLAEW